MDWVKTVRRMKAAFNSNGMWWFPNHGVNKGEVIPLLHSNLSSINPWLPLFSGDRFTIVSNLHLKVLQTLFKEHSIISRLMVQNVFQKEAQRQHNVVQPFHCLLNSSFQLRGDWSSQSVYLGWVTWSQFWAASPSALLSLGHCIFGPSCMPAFVYREVLECCHCSYQIVWEMST